MEYIHNLRKTYVSLYIYIMRLNHREPSLVLTTIFQDFPSRNFVQKEIQNQIIELCKSSFYG